MEYWFALWVFFSPNPYDKKDGLYEPYLVPLELAHNAYLYAEEEGDEVHPEEVIAMLVGEHGSAHPYPADSIGDGGKAVGLFQIHGKERREYNRKTGSSISRDELLDADTSLRVATWIVGRHKRAHAKRSYCKKKVADHVTKGEDGALRPVLRDQKHNWIAHWKCGVKYREECPTKRRELIIRQFAAHQRVGNLVAGPFSLAFSFLARYPSTDSNVATAEGGVKDDG